MHNFRLNRRSALQGGTLSLAAIGLLAGSERVALAAGPSDGDVATLNVALGLEHEAIAAYQIGAESGLLKGGLLDAAVLFQGHHKEHRDAQIATIKKLGGKPVDAKTADEYKKSPKLEVAKIKTGDDVLKLAQKLELGAINAYIGVLPTFADKTLAAVVGKLIADETLHYTVLTEVLKQELPKKGLSFGG